MSINDIQYPPKISQKRCFELKHNCTRSAKQ